MGETRAMIPIVERLKQHYPDAELFFSSTTETGHQEAQKSLPGGADYFFLPIDFSWTARRLVKRLRPCLLILSEGDLWFHTMRAVRKRGGEVVVLSGKISEVSARRFSRFPFLAKKLFKEIDLFCTQNEEYAFRIQSLLSDRERLSVTGNLKLATPSIHLSQSETASWLKTLGIEKGDKVLTVGSTHPNEEEEIIEQLREFSDYKILLVPRHPERFPIVKKLLNRLNQKNVILVDRMGILPVCYQLSELAIVGGSFLPGIGGHNVFEPIQAKIPVLFGPHMQSQKELKTLVLDAKAGKETSLQTLGQTVKEVLQNREVLSENAAQLASIGEESLNKTWKALEKHLP